MDVARRREVHEGDSIAETPVSSVWQYLNFETVGHELESPEQGFDGVELSYVHEIDPMTECMGAPVREVHSPPSKLSLAQEEAMLVTLEIILSRTEAQQDTTSADLQSLKDASGLMQQLWEGGSLLFPQAVKALLKLNSRGKIGAILGEAGFVDVFLGILGTGAVLDEIVIAALQFVGDACENNETNKARVVARGAILAILYTLWNPLLVPIAIPVIFQICINYEPAKQQAADFSTARILIDLLKRPEGEGVPKGGGTYPVLLTVCHLLDMMLKKGTELYSDATAKELFELTQGNECNPELYQQLINTATAWLKLNRVRQHLIADNNAELLLRILEESCTKPNLVLLSTPDGGKLLQNLRLAIVEALAAISVSPQFCVNYKLNGKLVATLREWLLMAYPQLQACACIILGNMANSRTIAKDMTQQFRLPEVCILLLEQCDSVQVKAAAAVLLKSLMVSIECRKVVAEKQIIKVASQLWAMNHSPQLQYLGVTLALQALEGSFSVLEQLLAPLSSDPDSPAHFKTQLTILMRLWQDCHGYQRHENLLQAISCVVANVCAMLWSSNPLLRSPSEVEDFKRRVSQEHADIGYPLRSLLRDGNEPVLRSKFWFVMALMAEDPQAVSIVADTVGAAEVSMALSGLLSRARELGGRQCENSHAQYDDRNVLIMISRLVKNTVSGEKIDSPKAARMSQNSFRSRLQSDVMLKLVEGVDLEAMSKENPLEPV